MINARYQMGRAGSLRIGAKAANRDADMILVTNIDQPRPAEFLKTLIQAFNPEHAGVRPVHQGHHGHPVVLSGRLREELMNVADDSEGLLAVIRAHASQLDEVETDDLLALDINTPADYEAARQRFGLA
jgi:CTP:molybdopterin cytidylyltransferase MocA